MYVVHLMNAGMKIINMALSPTYFIGVHYNRMVFISKFWPTGNNVNNVGTGDSFCVKGLFYMKFEYIIP